MGESIYQKSNPKTTYAKNSAQSFYNRVPRCRQEAEDWCIYDPKDCDISERYDERPDLAPWNKPKLSRQQRKKIEE